MSQFWQLDAPVLLAALLAGGTCGLLGSFLVLRRESLLGDALSHAVLPGIVAGFALTGLRSSLPMLLGALGAALLATFSINAVRRLARLESAAATGLVFTGFFAAGLVLLEVTGARSADQAVFIPLSTVRERWGERNIRRASEQSKYLTRQASPLVDEEASLARRLPAGSVTLSINDPPGSAPTGFAHPRQLAR